MPDTDRLIADVVRQIRNNTLDAAIEACEPFAETSRGANHCLRAIRKLKESLPPPPSDAN